MRLDQTKMDWLLTRSVSDGLPDELPARTADRASLLDASDILKGFHRI